MKKLALIAALACCTAMPAFANDDMSGDHMDHMDHMNAMAEYYFNKIDTNHDGKITPEEHAAFAKKMFEDADTTHKGYLTLDDVKAEKKKEHDEMKSSMNPGANSSSMSGSGMSGSGTNTMGK